MCVGGGDVKVLVVKNLFSISFSSEIQMLLSTRSREVASHMKCVGLFQGKRVMEERSE